MKRERELEVYFSAPIFDESMIIRVEGKHDVKNLKVILTEEVAEYYESLIDSLYGAYKVGEILKLSEFDNGKTKFPYRLRTKNGNKFWFSEKEVKPSTKEAYKAQFKKATELTVAEIEEKLGYKIKIIK